MKEQSSKRSWSVSRFTNRRRKGKVLAVKWGLNPNSSSLGVDVTFLLLGATALSIATPIVSAMVRLRLSRIQNPATPSSNNKKSSAS